MGKLQDTYEGSCSKKFMESFKTCYQWRTVLSEFPRGMTSTFREHYCGPAIYRWRVMRDPGEQTERIYIGQAENLARRVQRVLTPSSRARNGDTNCRLNKIFSDAVRNGRTGNCPRFS